jgi:hypothetical protein
MTNTLVGAQILAFRLSRKNHQLRIMNGCLIAIASAALLWASQ